VFRFINTQILTVIDHGRDRMVVGFTTTPVQSVPITTKVVSSNTVHGEVYSIQANHLKFINKVKDHKMKAK
jgi:gamma-glutamylcyclotransferase (GGCT)/AIG2-like uncharacterized protein YtfP